MKLIVDPIFSSSNRKTVDPRDVFLRIGALVFVIGLTVGIYFLRDHMKQLAAFGYAGIFLVSILANATIILPAPGVAFVFGLGAMQTFHPVLLAIAAGSGAAIGELSGYLAGYSGQKLAARSHLVDRMTIWMQKWGGWTILILAIIPNPFFDAAGMIAGILKMPLRKFLLFCLIGKILKMLLFAYSGSLVPWIAPD